MIVFALNSDLMFGSKMSAAAKSSGATLSTYGSAAGLIQSFSDAPKDCTVVLDLSCGEAKNDIFSLVSNIRESLPAARIIAFAPHVQELLLTNATDAGCDLVMSRGQFHREMDQLFAAE